MYFLILNSINVKNSSCPSTLVIFMHVTFKPRACKTVLLDTALPEESCPFCKDLVICLLGELLKCLGEEVVVFGESAMDDTDADRLLL